MSGGIDVRGVLPCVRKFNIVLGICGFDGVDVYMCICYFLEYLL